MPLELEVAGNQKYTGIIREQVLFKILQTSHILAYIRGEYSRGIFVIYSGEYSGGYSGEYSGGYSSEYSGEYSPRKMSALVHVEILLVLAP